ncbi:hypothetical protein BV25DRAFT_1780412, partial [Artomyces pyxidatus]
YISAEHPLFHTHLCRLGTAAAVPVLLGPTISRPDKSIDERESWARSMLILFKPWRGLQDLKRRDETWYEAYERYEFPVHLRKIIENIQVETECRDARTEYDVARR